MKYKSKGSFIFTITATTALLSSISARADNLFVANGLGNTIGEFPTTGGTGTVFASGPLLNNPNGLAFDNAGNLFVGNYAGNTIVQYTPNGVGSVFASTGLSAPYGMAFDSSGNLFVANAGIPGNYIEKYTPGGVGRVFTSSGLSYPTGMAFNSAGTLFVANNMANSIGEFTPTGVNSLFVNTGLNSPQGIAFDSHGNLFVANSGDGNPGSGYIEKYTPGGVGSVYANGLYFPDGLAFDSAGDLFVTSRGTSNNQIYEFSSTGVESTLTTDVSVPEFLAIEPTPEPSTWALLGLGAAVFVYFRRRQLPSVK